METILIKYLKRIIFINKETFTGQKSRFLFKNS